MSMPPQSRRDFLTSITAAGAVALVAPRSLDARTVQRSIGANDRIRIGIIGCGSRGIGTEMASVRDQAPVLHVSRQRSSTRAARAPLSPVDAQRPLPRSWSTMV